jgi:hypothetical protein
VNGAFLQASGCVAGGSETGCAPPDPVPSAPRKTDRSRPRAGSANPASHPWVGRGTPEGTPCPSASA